MFNIVTVKISSFYGDRVLEALILFSQQSFLILGVNNHVALT